MSRAREPQKLAPRLAEVRCPVLLLIGTARHDGDVDPREVSLLARTLRSFEVDSEPGAGHYLQEERPAAVLTAVERLAQKIR